jgi:hypothetical protein
MAVGLTAVGWDASFKAGVELWKIRG